MINKLKYQVNHEETEKTLAKITIIFANFLSFHLKRSLGTIGIKQISLVLKLVLANPNEASWLPILPSYMESEENISFYYWLIHCIKKRKTSNSWNNYQASKEWIQVQILLNFVYFKTK